MTWTLAAPLRRARIARRAVVAAPPKPAALPAPTPNAAATQAPLPTLRDWLGVLAMVVGLFMAIMDVQIVTSSLCCGLSGMRKRGDGSKPELLCSSPATILTTR